MQQDADEGPLDRRARKATSPTTTLDSPPKRIAKLIKDKLLAEACEVVGIAALGGIHADVTEAAEIALEREFRPEGAVSIHSGEPLTLDDLVVAATISTNQVGSGELSVEYLNTAQRGRGSSGREYRV